MRESEEYLEANRFEKYDSHGSVDKLIIYHEAEHAVKLAYKEGYLEALDDAYEALWGFTDLTSKDIEQILERIKKKFDKK